MLTIGLTGGIGSGKSLVADLFAKKGVPILDADLIAREVTLPGQPAFQAIVSHFNNDFLKKDGSINRAKLREFIFAHPEERVWLEKTLHPLIRDKIEKRIQEMIADYVIIVIPLLIETGAYIFIDRILVVDAPLSLQIDRVIERDQVPREQIETILLTQASREERLKKADDVILNENDKQNLSQQVDILHQKYLLLSAKK